MPLPHLRILLALALSCLAAFPALAAPEELLGKVRVPKGVAAGNLTVTVFQEPAHELENGPGPVAKATVSANGLFRVSAEPGPATNLEITGPGVRRARFPWPPPAKPGEQPVFELNPGVTLEGVVLDPAGKPIANALAGPIVPGIDVSAEGLGASYPFFLRSDAKGRLIISGVFPKTSYEVPIFAEGFHRTRTTLAPGQPFTIKLTPGGHPLAGKVVWEGTLKPANTSRIRLLGGPKELVCQRAAAEDGAFRFDNLAPGEYRLAPEVPSLGELKPQSFTVLEQKGVESIVLVVREGITIDATLADVETNQPIPNVPVTLRGQPLTTNQLGRFRADKVKGPWPLKVEIAAPLYDFKPEDQDIEKYPFNGYNGDDIVGVTLNLRRQRFLEIVTADGEKPQVYESGMAELWGPVEKNTESTRERISPAANVLPLESAGTRYVMVRTTKAEVSELLEAHTALADTTTTLLATLGAEARLDATLTYREDGSAVPSTLEVTRDLPGDRRIKLGGGPLDLAGKLTVAQLPPGEVTVRFTRAEGAPYVEEKVVLKRGETVTLAKQIAKGFSIAGRVIEEGTGKELAEIPLSFYGSDPDGQPLNLSTMSKAKGVFRVEGFGGPTLRELRINHAQYAPVAMADIALPLEKDLEISLKPRQGITVTIDSPAPSLVTARAYILQGREQPAAEGLSQWFFEQDSTEPFASKPTVVLVPRSGGRIRVAAEAEGRWDVSEPFDWSETSPAKEIQLSPQHTAALDVSVPGLDQAAVAALDVALVNTTLPQSAGLVETLPTARSNERLSFNDLPAGNYFLVASTADGATAALNNIALVRGQRQQATLTLRSPSLELAGSIMIAGEPAVPADGAAVTVRYGDVPEPDVLAQAVADGQGRFSVAPLPGGRPYLVEVAWKELQRSFPVPPAPEGAARIEQQFVITRPVAVVLKVPAGASTNTPWLLLSEDASQSVTVRAENLGQPVSLTPGTWTVSQGEERIGSVVIGAQTTEVELPVAGGQKGAGVVRCAETWRVKE